MVVAKAPKNSRVRQKDFKTIEDIHNYFQELPDNKIINIEIVYKLTGPEDDLLVDKYVVTYE